MDKIHKIYDPRSNVATTAAKYRASWGNHITELTSVLLEAGIPANEWEPMLHPLRNAVDTAADRLIAEGAWPKE